MKIMLMDATKLVNLVLPREVFGNYWIVNDKKENLVSVQAIDNSWVLKSNSEVKVFRNGTAVEEALLEEEKFYTLKNILLGDSYVIYTCPVYDANALQLRINYNNLGNVSSWYIGNNGSQDNLSNYPNVISYEQPGVARNQLKINYNGGMYSVQNLNPSIPMYVNGLPCESAELKYGDSIFMLGFKLSIVKDIFYVNNPNKLVKFDSQIFVLREVPTLDYSKISTDVDPVVEMYKKEDYFLKPPRFDEKIEEKTLVIDPPPAPQKQEDMPAIFTMGSMMMMGMSSVMSGVMTLTNVLNGTSSLGESLPSLLTASGMLICMLVLPTASKMYQKHKKRLYERKRQATYSMYVNRKREEFLNEMRKQQQILVDKYIPLKDVGDVVLYKKRNLWEKNTTDYDFLSLRLGIGSIPPYFTINYPDEHFTMEEEDNLMLFLRELEKETSLLENVPVTYSFVKKYITAIIGQKNVTNPFLRGLLLQIFAYHGYDSLKVCVFTNKENAKFWEDIKDCPYFWNDQRTLRYFGTNGDEITQISSYFEEMLAALKEANQERSNGGSNKGEVKLSTRYLIITDDVDLVRNVSVIRSLVESESYVGISLIMITDKLNSLPNEVEHFISVDERMGTVFERVISDSKRVNFVPDFMYGSLEKYTYILSNIPIAINGGKFQLPAAYSFLEMYNVSNVNQLNALSRWKESDPINSLATPIGINEYGELFKLDLHEKAHGPHGLIAGMTGSGKSEFIITFILSAALNYHPNEVQFVLIDYKGGGLAGAFENRETGLKLPHLAGTITNLDVSEINRSLASLQSELKRRQAEFNKARDKVGESTIDIYKYQRLYRNGQVENPIAHLFIISDEFAELKSQQPEFMSELISTARIGRSLGVHLILATQKPSGVVNDPIWSNSKFKVCLKVQDRSDSQEMIKRPDAASLKETGRFYLQVGYDEYFALGQSAWAGAPYYESDVRKKKVDNTITFVDNLGMPFKIVEDGKNSFSGVLKGEELPNVMKYLVEIARKEKINIKQLWLNSLAPVIFIDALKEKYSFKKEDCVINPVIGEYDAPNLQKQGLLTMPISADGNWIIYGMADSGKEDMINALVYSCITTYSPMELNMYLLDFGAETLKMYRKAPQVGDVILQNDVDKVTNLWRMISEKVASRKKLFADYGGDYASYLKATGKVLPNIMVIINGFELYNENYGDATFDLLATITRDCQKYGVYFVMTSTTANGIRSRLAQYLPNHLCFQMNDKYDYSSLLARTKLEPSNIVGRGLVKLDTVYEWQSAVPCDKENLSTIVLEKINQLIEAYPNVSAPKVPVLPEVVSVAYCKEKLTGLNSVPVGVEKESLDIRCLDLTKNLVHLITAAEAGELKNFTGLFIREISSLIGKNCFVFDMDKILPDVATVSSYYDTSIGENFKSFGKIVFDAFEKYKAAGFDAGALADQAETVCFIVGFDKFKNVLGTDFDSAYGGLVSMVKAMPKFNFILVDTCDNFKKREFESWYKDTVSGTKGIWLGNGMGTQYTIKSSTPARLLSAKLDKNFGYFVDGNTTVLVKLISETGETEDNYETL